MPNKETIAEYYRRVGRMFRFPECCISYFILYSDTGMYWKAYNNFVIGLHVKRIYRNGRSRYGGYVPCPRCLEDNVQVPEERAA